MTSSLFKPGFEHFKIFVNGCLCDKEPWQIVTLTTTSVLAGVWLWGFIFQEESLLSRGKKTAFRLARKIPMIARRIDSELDKINETFEKEVINRNQGNPYITTLPDKGKSHTEIVELVKQYLKFETLKRAACDPFLKCKLAFCKTIADECQPFLQRFQTSKPMTPYLFEAVEKLLRYLMNRCVKPDLMKCTGPKLLSIDTKKSENLILSKNIDIGFATKRLLGETAITVTERQKLEFIHECRSMLTTMIAKLQEKSPLKQKAVRGLSSLDPCVIQHSPQLAQKRFSFLLEELNHANIINDVLAENAKKEYLHFCNLKKSELQEIFRPCDQFSDEVGLDTIYGSFLIGEANYKHLWEVIKICLVLSHGNATVEGGFSVNKSLLVENMHEKTVIAQRHIHDEIQEAGGIKNIHISKKMLDYVRGARKRYHEYLEMKKQEKSEKDKKKAEKRKLDIQVKDLEGERKKLMMATEEKREAIDVELQELKKKQASLY
uniref:Uncharacterized protein n=1 Tax=Timema cristinae TaxID=61476 RepID=A0A7R9CVW5_TIMCR|nr:unnamed protein product [Timema cristinae]